MRRWFFGNARRSTSTPSRSTACSARRRCARYNVWHHSHTDPSLGGRPDRGTGSLFKDPGIARSDAGTQLVWEAKKTRLSVVRPIAYLPSSRETATPCCPTHVYPPVPVPQPSGGLLNGPKHAPDASHVSQRDSRKTISEYSNKVREARARCPRHIKLESLQRNDRYKRTGLTPRTSIWYSRDSQVGHSNHESITPSKSRNPLEFAYSSKCS